MKMVKPSESDMLMVRISAEFFHRLMKAVGRQIDPETAEVTWCYAQTLDPYGVNPELPQEFWQVGREYFARASDTDIWVNFDDLPNATHNVLWKKHRHKLEFPAGLEEILCVLKTRSRRRKTLSRNKPSRPEDSSQRQK
jgi:hypothetical protein